MYLKLSEKEIEKVQKISSITCTDYELLGDFIPVESLLNMSLNLLIEAEALQEKMDDIIQSAEQEKIDPYLEYGVNENDF